MVGADKRGPRTFFPVLTVMNFAVQVVSLFRAVLTHSLCVGPVPPRSEFDVYIGEVETAAAYPWRALGTRT